MAAGSDLFNRFIRSSDELGGIKRLGKIYDVNQVMRHAPSLFSRRFGCADVQSLVDLHGINGNDLALQPLREQQGQRRFSRRRRAREEQKGLDVTS
jgi:hypothetical protein